MAFSLVFAHLISFLLECILYGIYVPLFVATVYVLFWRPKDGVINKLFAAVTIIMFILATMHIAATMQLAFEAFIFEPTPPGPIAVLADSTRFLDQFRKVLDTIAIIVGDGLVIYRCYVIWSRNWKIVLLPVLFLVFNTVAGRYVAALLSTSGVDPLTDPRLVLWIPLFFGSSFATNCLVTLLIAYRLITAGKRVSAGGSNPYWRTIAIITESGAVYLVANFATLILFAAKSPASIIPASCFTQLIAIAPTIIILQVQTGFSQARTSHGPSRSIGAQSGIGGHGSHAASAISPHSRSFQPTAHRMTHFGTTTTDSDYSNKHQPHPPPMVVKIQQNVDSDSLHTGGGTYSPWEDKPKPSPQNYNAI